MHIDSNQQNGIEKYQDSGSKPQLVITGMACRLPGANNLIELAEVLSQGRDLVTTIPKSRFDIQDWYDANPDAKGKTNVKHGAFLDRFKEFDAAAFGIPPREAMALDPQQRLLLEVCQEAIDDANLGGQQRIENTGVYVGISGTDYLQLQCRQWSRSEIDAYSGTGTASSMCAGRISHQLGLRGPNLAVDTACSSSLVAMHLACQALRAGECEAALVAGVNLLLAPDPFIYLSKLKVLSADGTCKAFDAKANGYVRGEGVLAVVIQLDRGKEIAAHTRYATVSGSAMNHDGDTSGMTAPSRVAQSDLVRMALESSKLKPADIDVVEGHGTGTPLGDPIELSALNDVFGCGRSVDRPLWLSSLKTNMGHLEAAAGLAGLFKAVLQLKSECIYPHLHCVQPTPFFDWKSSPIRLPVRKQPWPQTDSPRRACISSFGFSGVNCHVVLEQVSNKRERFANANRNDRTVSPLCLSASAESSLRKQADQIAKQLESATAADLFEIGHTAAVARQHRSYRLAVIGRSVDQTKQALRQYAGTGQASPALYHGTTSKHRTNHLVFQFTGQGSWKPGIGKQIFDEEPAFRAAIHECDQLLSGRIDRPLTELLFEPPGDATTAFPQVATVVFEVALASLWREWGLSPTAVIGHSLGEYVAAWYSGIFCLEELLRAIVVRDRLIQQWCPAGAMLAVLAPQEHLTPLLNREIEVAALNGPRSTVLTGKPESVAAVRRRLTEKQIPFQQLNVGFAFHSQSVNEAAKRFREHLEDICFRPASLTLARNLDGALLPPGQTLDAEYFFQQMLSPVCYEAAVRALIRTGRNTFLELGPNSTLSNLGPAIEKDPSILWESSLKNGVDDREQLARATATLFVRGIEIDWLRRDRGYAYSPRALPAYPFERTEFFPEFGLRKEVSDSVEVESQRRSAKPEPTQLAADFDEVVQATTEPESARSLPLYLTEWIEEKHSQLSDTHGDLVLWVAGNDVAAAEKFLALGDVDQIVTPGNQWSRGDRSTSIVPDRKEHIEKVLSLFPREGSDETVLVYGWGISTDAFDDSAEQLVLGGLLAIIQCLARHSNPGQFRLIVLTKGSQRTGREVYQRDQSVESVDVEIQLSRATLGGALWGLVRVINSEHPHLRCEIVDLAGDQSNPESLDWIVHHRHELSSEPHYALRDEKRYFPRWTTIPVVNPSSLNLAPDARYIISGGLGSIGLSLAERFVERGARTLVLIGRQSANDSVLPRLQKMRQSGARVVTIAGDIASPEIVRQVLEDPSSKDLPIKGIVHAAGVLRDASLLELNLSDLSAVLAPKILGARRLRDIAAGQPLEFFVLLSSTASQLGSPGQGAYAAANSWLESFAEYEATKGINALAISLGLWGESGMAMRLSSGQLRRWQSLGFDPLHADTGLSAIETAIARTGNVCVLSANWKQFAATIPPGLEPPIVRRLFDRESNATPELLKWLSVRDKLFELSPQEQLEAACDYVNQTIHQILGISKGSAGIDRDRGFFDLGMDSVMVLEYRNRIQIAVGDTVRLPQTFAFDYPTIHRSAKFILESLHPSPSDSRQASAPRSKTSDRDGIAVIGIGCRFPGGINDADQYWQCLIDGIDAVDRVPDERRRLSAWHDDGMNDEESRVCRLGSFLAEVDQFDAEFFQVSPREARAIDPQQRLLLEVAWECLESGGLAGCRLDRETTGVFVGVSSYDYSRVLERINSISEIDRYLGTGNAPSMSAGRINHLLGFGGPAITIDTACSSSLTAVHLACDSILRGESEVALAGGVNLILSPESSLSLFRGKMLAADGRCKVFDADANGYVRGEGCGIIALKRLSAARRDGDFVHAVIRGSAVNHDGPSAGLTVPSGKSQRRLLNQAYESANVDPQEIDFVETHGTGTPLGDPIEINTLASVTSSPNRCRPLLLGAVKSNLGHLEAAAGIAGLIKSLLAVRHGVLPPNLHFHSPNQNIDWQAAKLDVVVAPTRLPTGRRIAGVSSFGFSGTNVHVVIESPSPEDDARANHSEQLSPLFLSAASPGAMHAWAAKLSRYLEVSTADEQLADFIWSCNTGRAHLSTRVVIEVSDRQSLIQSLAQVARGGEGQYQEPVTSAGRNWHLASQKFLAGGTVSSETLLGDDHRKMMALPT
ncbi:MAG: SDR family NAD(P)-dependent oxidoreductase, partial [Planctomycetales bacterium]|nr:SDR family NAD(P)-dependent oxidoreductase [Planctomycetales bacterium]